ncbi:aerotolerance regulator BatA [Lujinxingia litoralis]|uniref:Aerotolerance regulator BatA n=1 Tax=Lujinxingia litoralis TaxID=2211119 RepID=A0A328C610_9DELT|nr:VWA domain-containing protein [Lujinxingia litoralis]RAL21563.1 aerotolerance regulator BatA [Lujinxingia litoralis]
MIHSAPLVASVGFAHPWVLALLILVPILGIFFIAPRFRARRQPSFLFSATGRLAERPRGPRVVLDPLIDLAMLAALAAMIVALARPQTSEPLPTAVEGIDIFVALDMSGSMRAIDLDVSQARAIEARGQRPPTRFEDAVRTLREFVATRHHDRIGVVLFAQDAFLQFPLTLDHELLDASLADLQLGDIDDSGTAIGNALGRAVAGLVDSQAESKLIILITDGDRRGGNISPLQAAEMAAEIDAVVYPILVGREGNALMAAGRDIFSGRTAYQSAEFPINPELMTQIAETTGGQYFRAFDARSMREDLHEIIDAYDRSELEDTKSVRYQEHFHLWALLSLLLLSVHFFARHTLCRTFP